MRRLMVLGSVVVLVLLAGACGGDDDDGSAAASDGDDSGGSQASESGPSDPASRDEYVDAIGETLTFLGVTDEDSACIADVYIDVIGLDQLNELATPDEIRETANLTELGADLDESDGDAFYAGVNQCLDVREFFLGLVAGDNEEARACLDQAISEDALQEAFVGGLLLGSESLDPEVESSITDAYEQCAGVLGPTG